MWMSSPVERRNWLISIASWPDPSSSQLLRGGGKSTQTVMCVITGTAGVGKTALALRWAHRVHGEFPDGQLYVNLRGCDPDDQPMSAGDALAGFLRALGLPGQDIPLEMEERAAAYRSLLNGRRMVVALDNAATVEQVRPLLPGTASCAVLVTSRDSLVGLVARHGARRLDLSLLPLQDAVALLQELIGERIDAEPGAAAALTDQCARLPLALRIAAELATAHPTTSLAELVSDLSDEQRRLKLLDAGGIRAPRSGRCSPGPTSTSQRRRHGRSGGSDCTLDLTSTPTPPPPSPTPVATTPTVSSTSWPVLTFSSPQA
jgi:hypothetical protein